MNPRVFTKNAKEESECALDKTDDSAAFFVRLDRQQPPRSSPAGATFPTPLAQIIDRKVDFGASDAPLTDKQLADAPGRILHFPTVLGADVIIYNLPRVTERLRFTGPLVADIFLRKITKWNDQAIAELNPGVKLPESAIVVCHRSDGSGTTYVFTDYLSKISPEWASKVGKGTSVPWPVGFAGNGNQSVTELVKQTSGAIGYVELVYALQDRLPVGLL
jgi:phosphate transport system substrate-binding protein